MKVLSNGVSRVIERQPASSNIPPQRYLKMSAASVVVVALCLLCFLLDPRDYQVVLAAEGVHPHPGPDGVVMQAVETIEDKLQRQKRDDDREQVEEGGAKKQRCSSPPLASCGSTISHTLSTGHGKEGKKRSTEDLLENGSHGQNGKLIKQMKR